MKVIQCVQRSPEWWLARRGLPTASDFDKILTPATLKPSVSQGKFICELIAQKFASVYPDTDGYVSPAMQNGIDTEDDARNWYEFQEDVDVQQVGLCVSDCERYGCSPDGLIGDEGCLELKCPSLETQAKYLLEGGLPREYRCQCHGQLIVTGRKWIDFVSFCPGLPTHKFRVEPDSFTDALANELDAFCKKYATAIKTIEALR